ncbi:hypothetical protein PA25_03750 [Pseudoalteromonas sp. A25]|uniref:Ig-like domain-containing protein n=1 Tax=Pseudoalteromonas sp. A25 TaxID=116092 RepID=UPI00126107F7|nr:Ig-like domain-containing protein [Pseudoalteromonas sp. A25]BBN80390.1 hypothetical protein PA25_03750 [Pseudoalteromonas sp. A25]
MYYKTTLTIAMLSLLSACSGSDSQPSVKTTTPDTSTGAQAQFQTSALLQSTLNEDASVQIDISAQQVPTGTEALQLSIIEPTQLGTLTGQYPNLTYSPKPNMHGNDRFVYQLKKGEHTSEEVTVKITITAVNDKPELSGSPAQNVIKLNDDFSFSPIVDDVDTDTSGHIFNIINKPQWAQFDTSNGTLSGAPKVDDDLGVYKQIKISLTDGDFTTELTAFDIEVVKSAWQPITQLPNNQGSHLKTTVLNNKLVTLSHLTSLSSAMSCSTAPQSAPTFMQLDTNHLSWLVLPRPEESRYYYHAVSTGSKLYLFGGTQACPSTSSAKTTMEIFDSESLAWSSVSAPVFSPYENTVLASCANSQHVAAFTSNSDSLYLYLLDVSDNTWKSEALELPVTDIHNCAFVGEKLFMTTTSDSHTNVNLTQFDINTLQITINEHIPADLADLYHTLASDGGSLQVHSPKAVMQYQIDTQQWQALTVNPYASEVQGEQNYYLRDYSVEQLEGKYYQLGGAFTTQSNNQVYLFNSTVD